MMTTEDIEHQMIINKKGFEGKYFTGGSSEMQET
jgi:hypothetical protein